MSRLQEYLKHTPISQQSTAAIAFLAGLETISATSPVVASAIEKELHDQRTYLKLIASENYCSPATQLAMGNWLTDKYAEGSVYHRFYAGCDNVDTIEAEANQQLINLFGADHAYAQPHSGADANMVAFWTILVQRIQNPALEKLGKKNLESLTAEEYETIRKLLVSQKIMGMSLNSGGHLTHGFRANISSKMMQAVNYEVDPETQLINYKTLAEQVKREKPAIFLAGSSAYPGKLNFAIMREIADSVGAVFMVDMAHFAGLVAGKVFTGDFNPIPFAHIITSTSHKTLRGPRGGFILCQKEFSEVVDKGCPLVLGGPLPHVLAAKAVAFREANTPAFQKYAHQIVDNAQTLAQSLMDLGVKVTTDGTENHLLVLDLTKFKITGRQAEEVLREAHMNVNRNTIPGDPNGPWFTSGIRLGTPATTTLGMGKEEMEEIAHIIVEVLTHTKADINPENGQASRSKACVEPDVLASSQKRISELLQAHPLYPEIAINYAVPV